MKALIPIVVILSVAFSSVQPDKRFKLKHDEDNVKVYYRWKNHSNPGGKAEKTLVLYLANENDYRVQVRFCIDIYKSAFLSSSSDTLTYCIPPDYRITGNFRHLEFSLEGTALDTTGNDEGTDWEINDFSVVKNDTCVTSTNWRNADK